MDESPRCQSCGVALTGQVVGELCANCLLKLALEPPAEPTAVVDELGPSSAEPIRVRYFGDYELVEEIARGGMGVVYKARQVSLNRIVALKMILAGDFSSPAMVERFQTEAEAAARLEHPNIVPIYEIGAHEGQHYFSMRFVEGGSLAQQILRSSRRKEAHELLPLNPQLSTLNPTQTEPPYVGCYSPKEAARLLVKVARAVHHAHQHGILHRDLKPGNILLDSAGEPHVADFGLAKLLEHDSALTQSAAVMGTPSYMAPEQAQGQTKQATTTVDIYSLGAILYELLTGRPPFMGSNPLEVLAQVREREPAPPQSLNPDLDRDLAVICLKCLEKDPARRYGSAEALAEDLQRWLANEPIQARRTTLPERAWKWARRKPVVASLLVAILLVGQAGIVGILFQTRRANVEAANARAEFKRAESELWNANFNEARALRIVGGSGARVHSAALVQKLLQRPGLTERQILNLREEAIAQLALMDIAMPTNWISKPSRYPLAWNSMLDRYVRDTGSNRVELCEYPSERVLASFSGPVKTTFDQAVFSADNQFLAVRFGDANGEVRVWSLATLELVLKTASEKIGEPRIYFSPDSRTLATLTSLGIAVQPLAAQSRPRLLRGGGRAIQAVAFSPDSKHIVVLPASRQEPVQIVDANSGETRCSFQPGFNPYRVAWHPDGTRLVLGGRRGKLEIRTIDLNNTGTECAGQPVSLDGHLNEILQLLFAPDGSTLLTYAWDFTSIAWDLITGRPLLRDQRLHLSDIHSTGDRVIGSRRKPLSESVATLIHRTGYRTVAWAGQARTAYAVCTSPDGRLGVVSYPSIAGQSQGQCLLWDFSRGVEIARLQGICAQFSTNSRTLFTFEAYADNCVRRYDVRAETLANRPVGWSEGIVVYRGRQGERINTGTMSGDGRTLVIAATDAVVFLDTLGQQPTRSWPKPAHDVSVSNDGQWLATRKQNLPAALRSAHDAEVVLRSETDSRMNFSPDSRWVAVVTLHTVQLYAPGFPARMAYAVPLEAGDASAPPLAFSPNSQIFAVPYNRTHVRLYETSTGRELATLSPPNLAPIMGHKALEFSPDGQWLLAAKDDGETVAWNLPVIRAELAKLGLDWEDQP